MSTGDHDNSAPATAPIGTVVVTLPADLDYASATQINTQLAAAFTPTTHTVIADLSGTAFCDTSGLRELILASKLANTTHTELRLVIPPGHTRLTKMFTITGLIDRFAIYPTVSAAMTTEPGPPPPPTAPTTTSATPSTAQPPAEPEPLPG